MKKIILLLYIFNILSHNILSQTNKIVLKNFPEAIINVADSMRMKYNFYYKFYANFSDSIFYYKNARNKYVGIDFPVIKSKEVSNRLYKILDSLSKSNIYTDKIIANNISQKIVEYYSLRRDSICYYFRSGQ